MSDTAISPAPSNLFPRADNGPGLYREVLIVPSEAGVEAAGEPDRFAWAKTLTLCAILLGGLFILL